MCEVLQIPKSTFYYEAKQRRSEDDVTNQIIHIFKKNCKVAKLREEGLVVSRGRIGRIMREQGLVSTYTVAQYKPYKAACNESKQANELKREFQQTKPKRAVVSDLTYVKVKNRWHYILCIC